MRSGYFLDFKDERAMITGRRIFSTSSACTCFVMHITYGSLNGLLSMKTADGVEISAK